MIKPNNRRNLPSWCGDAKFNTDIWADAFFGISKSGDERMPNVKSSLSVITNSPGVDQVLEEMFILCAEEINK